MLREEIIQEWSSLKVKVNRLKKAYKLPAETINYLLAEDNLVLVNNQNQRCLDYLEIEGDYLVKPAHLAKLSINENDYTQKLTVIVIDGGPQEVVYQFKLGQCFLVKRGTIEEVD